MAFSGCRPEGKLHRSETFSHSAICEIASWCANTRIAALEKFRVWSILSGHIPKKRYWRVFLSDPTGRGSYGVEAASLAWYGRKSGEVEIAQAAHLASLAAGTSDRNEILENLRASGSITSDELAAQRKYPFPNLSNRLSIRVLSIKWQAMLV